MKAIAWYNFKAWDNRKSARHGSCSLTVFAASLSWFKCCVLSLTFQHVSTSCNTCCHQGISWVHPYCVPSSLVFTSPVMAVAMDLPPPNLIRRSHICVGQPAQNPKRLRKTSEGQVGSSLWGSKELWQRIQRKGKPFCKEQSKNFLYPLVNDYTTNYQKSPLLMGKLTLSTGPLSSSQTKLLVITRG